MITRTISIQGLRPEEINNILEFNLRNGWLFLGYGMTQYTKYFKGLCIKPKRCEYPIMSFKHDDYTEKVEFKER